MKRNRFLIVSALLLFLTFSGCAGIRTIGDLVTGEGKLAQDAVIVQVEVINNMIIVPVWVNGYDKPMKFMLHTGIGSGIDPKSAALAGIQPTLKGIGRTLAGEIKEHDYGAVDRFEIGKGVVVTNELIQFMDTSSIRENIGVEVDGVIGSPMMRHFEVTIDYRHQRLIFQDPEKSDIDKVATNDNVYTMPYDLAIEEGWLIMINGKANNQVKSVFVVDTGYLGDIFLAHDTMVYLGYLDKLPNQLPVAQLEGESIGGYTGLYQQPTMGKLNDLRFGAMDVGPTLFVSAQGENNLLGGNVLRNYRITFNHIKRVIVFRQYEDKQLRTQFFSCGLNVGERNGKIVVTGLVKNSEADRLGIRAMDVIVKVNGKDANMLGLQQIQRILLDDTVKTIDLEIQREGGNLKATIGKADLLDPTCLFKSEEK